MKDWDDEIHRALAHPIRRRIIECLQERNNLSFQELLKYVGISNHGKLGFHIKALKGLAEREPVMKKYRLTDRGQLAGELIWDTRFIVDRGGRDLALDPTRYVRRLRLGDHAFLCYDAEDVKREICFSYLEAGLPKGEAVVYLVSERKMGSEGREIQRYGISAEYFHTEAFTMIPAEEWYMKKGKAQAKTIITNALTLLKEKKRLDSQDCVALLKWRSSLTMQRPRSYQDTKQRSADNSPLTYVHCASTKHTGLTRISSLNWENVTVTKSSKT